MKILLQGGAIVNEGETFRGDVLVDGETIERVCRGEIDSIPAGTRVINVTGKHVMPGVIDDQVHFREPGLEHKGNIASESRAAAAGGVTSYMDMPNVLPPTTSHARLLDRRAIASHDSIVNYSFYLGASPDNLAEIRDADARLTCGVKVFMGSSTGDLLVEQEELLDALFAASPLLVAAHCEDNAIIRRNLEHLRALHGDPLPPECHPLVRDREACLVSSSRAARLARARSCRLHILHLSARQEIDLLDRGPRAQRLVTGEACIHHLWFNDSAYRSLGHRVKWNPAIKEEADRVALLRAVAEGRIDVIATDHAPHLPGEKDRPYEQAASGGPMVQHSLPVMLELVERGEITLPAVIDAMCHAPADIFRVDRRGYLRPGYKADIALFERRPWRVTTDNLLYKCGWSPIEGLALSHRVTDTLVNGQWVYRDGILTGIRAGQPLLFNN
jgi:dihydroorotase